MPIQGTLDTISDRNQNFTMAGLSGTLGPTYGTAEVRPLTVTDDGKLQVNASVTAGSYVNIVTGTQQLLGTLQVGTVYWANQLDGTNDNVAVGGTDSGGTYHKIITDTTGRLKLASDGTVTQVSTVSALTTGSVTMTNGTLTTGTLQNLVTGTINALAAGTITGGTLQNLVSGTINALAAGTITGGTLQNLVSGTINALATGTITGGTLGNLNYGTITLDPKPVQVGTYAMTLGTTGAAAWGTMVASVGNGLRVYVTGVDVVVSSGTVDIAVTNNVAGSAGTGVFVRGQFVQGGGISKNFIPTLQTGTGGTIAYWMGGAGTATLGIQYWVAA